ncbi:TPA: hypothetical protein ACJS4Y_001791, partial [Streptococcus pyogenes]
DRHEENLTKELFFMLLLYQNTATLKSFLWLYAQFFVAVCTVFCGCMHSFLWLYYSLKPCKTSLFFDAKE